MNPRNSPSHPTPCRLVAAHVLSLALLLLVNSSHFLAAQDEYVARVHTSASGKALPYRLLVPKDYPASKKYPLVIFFHGAGERGNDNAAGYAKWAGVLKPIFEKLGLGKQ
jgi:predicted peptidase